jgi:hypothetical protein
MAATAVIVRKPTKIDTIVLDASVSETHTLTNTVTYHPVEEGAAVSDHSRPEPDEITLEGLVSNTPLSRDQQTRAIQSGSVTFQSSAPQENPGRAEDAFRQLKALRDAGTLVSVVTTLRTYGATDEDKMAITSISIPRDYRTADAFRFTITLRRVRVVKNKLTRNVVAKDKRVGSKVKKGTETPKDAGVNKSQLAKGYDAAQGKSGLDAFSSAVKGTFGF